MSDRVEQVLYAKGYRIRTVNGREEWYKVSDLPQPAKREPNPGHDALGENPREDALPGFRVVRLTSYRLRLIDERNLFDKYIVDALVRAKLLRDDTPKWCRIEVLQVKVYYPELERTEVEITG